jgi:hypothetical protein
VDPHGLYDPADWKAAYDAARAAAISGAGVGAAGGLGYGLVAVGGFAAGYGIGYYPGQLSAASPWNPFVYGPLNPFGTPFNPYALPGPVTQGPKQKPKCEPLRLKPFEWTPPAEFPFNPPLPSGTKKPPPDKEKDEECFKRCQHLISASLDGSAYRKCYRTCMGSLW